MCLVSCYLHKLCSITLWFIIHHTAATPILHLWYLYMPRYFKKGKESFVKPIVIFTFSRFTILIWQGTRKTRYLNSAFLKLVRKLIGIALLKLQNAHCLTSHLTHIQWLQFRRPSLNIPPIYIKSTLLFIKVVNTIFLQYLYDVTLPGQCERYIYIYIYL